MTLTELLESVRMEAERGISAAVGTEIMSRRWVID